MGSGSRQEAKGIKLDIIVKNFAGEPVKDLSFPDGKNADGSKKFKPLILRNVLTDSLLRNDVAMDGRGVVVPVPTEPSIKHKRFLLAQAIYNAGKRHQFTSGETEILKEQVSKHHPTVVAGMVRIMLDPAEARVQD